MPDNSDRRRRRISSIAAAAAVVLYILPLVIASVFAAAEFLWDGEGFVALLFLMVYGVLGGAVVAGVLLALRQRLREIDGGEEDDARQY